MSSSESIGVIDKTIWGVVKDPVLTGSGVTSMLARFRTRKEAEDWARMQFGKRWRHDYKTLYIPNLMEEDLDAV